MVSLNRSKLIQNQIIDNPNETTWHSKFKCELHLKLGVFYLIKYIYWNKHRIFDIIKHRKR